jgi:transcriptional regulator with XRE-family HTH domain
MDTSEEKNRVVDVDKIRQLCEVRGIPFAEFGRRVGIDNREGISRRLQNRYKISGDELILMARELGVQVEELAAV